jgi:hypothetical protein
VSSPLYKNTGKIPLASRLSMRFREKMFMKFMAVMKPDLYAKVLDVGVTSDAGFQESNYFENMYPHKKQIVCIGTEDGSYLEEKYPGIKFLKVNPDAPLPFADKEFDIAFSNAVIEHAGNGDSQKKFVKELSRVSKAFFLTTPNRWFPVEFHTALPVLHFLPKKIHRWLLSKLGYEFWSDENNLNLLSKNQLRNLFSEESDIVIDSSIKLFGVCTNLIAYKPSTQS